MSKKQKTIEELLEEALVPEDEQPYAIPRDWVWVRFLYLVKESKLGLVRSSNEQSDEKQFPYLKMNNITVDGRLDLSKLVRVNSKEEELSQYTLKNGDFLFNTRNSIELVGKSGIFNGDLIDEPTLFNNNILRVRFWEGFIPTFVNYYLNSPYGKDSLNSVKSGTTNVAAIYAKNLNTIPVPIPPLSEQKRITDKITRLLDKINLSKEIVNEIPNFIKTFRDKILISACRGDLTSGWRANKTDLPNVKEHLKGLNKRIEPKDIEAEAFSLPSKWTWVRLEELMDPEEAFCYGVVQPREDITEGPRLIRVCDLSDGRVIRENLRGISEEVHKQYHRSVLKGGELLVSLVGTIGRTAIVSDECKGYNIARAIAKVPIKSDFSNIYVSHWLMTPIAQAWMVGNSREVARKTLNLQQLKDLPVPLPSTEEQLEIVKRVERMLLKIEKIEQYYTDLENEFKILPNVILNKAFRGELGTNDISEENAIELLKEVLQEQVR